MMQLNFNIEPVFAVLQRNGCVRMSTDKNGEFLPVSMERRLPSPPYKSVLKERIRLSC
jgi:hypothetical protein